MTRYALRVDANQTEIVEALRAAGATVEIIGLPTDLLVGIAGAHGPIFAFFECKTLVGKRNPKPSKTTRVQDAFFAKYAGYPVSLVDSVECALRHLSVLRGAV